MKHCKNPQKEEKENTMKNRIHYAAMVLTALAIALLAACGHSVDTDEPQSSSNKKVKVPIIIGGVTEGRTALPDGAGFTKYTLTFTSQGGFGYTHSSEDILAGNGINVELEEDDWEIHVEAYVASDLSGTGEKVITVEPGMLSITITINEIEAAGTGTLHYDITYPTDDDTNHNYVKAEIAISGESPIDISGASSGNQTLDAGVYTVIVSLVDDIQHTKASLTEVVHIYRGLTTDFIRTIEANQFEAVIPVTGTATGTAPGGYTITKRTITVYSDSSLTTQMDSGFQNGAGDFAFTLFVPSKDSGAMYFQQEIEVTGGTSNGPFKGGTVLKANTTQADWNKPYDAGTIADNFHSITQDTTATPATQGTITPDKEIAVAGDTITLTVAPEPGSGYVLKTGTVPSVKPDGSGPFNASGVKPGPFTFTMPDDNVTVSAEFIILVEFTIDGPEDADVSINASDTSMSYGAAESIVFTIVDSGSVVTGYEWVVDGVALGSTSDSVTIDATDYVAKTYTLTAKVQVGGIWYSKSVDFTVTE
jgi:hypothetical protein